ncbi:hypothetical protein [Phenylobacterium sp.]|nr:hypothetical protein [Phenylobacterium sp.]
MSDLQTSELPPTVPASPTRPIRRRELRRLVPLSDTTIYEPKVIAAAA